MFVLKLSNPNLRVKTISDDGSNLNYGKRKYAASGTMDNSEKSTNFVFLHCNSISTVAKCVFPLSNIICFIIKSSVHVCCLHLKMEFCSCASGRQWCGIIHYYWWTASIKPRLLFSRAGYASWGLSLSSVFLLLRTLFAAFNLQYHQPCYNHYASKRTLYFQEHFQPRRAPPAPF